MKKLYFLLTLSILGLGSIIAQPTCFTHTATIYPGGASSWIPVIDDFNNDGKPDFAATAFNGNNIYVYLGNGTGAFSNAAGSPINYGSSTFGVASGDFTGDGNKDLVVATTGFFRLYTGNGTGAFVAGPNINFAASFQCLFVEAADFDNNGTLDVAFSNNSFNSAYIYSGSGTGTFTQFTGSPYSLPGTQWAVKKGDYNNDGKTDLAFSQNSTGGISILLGTGTGSFTVLPPNTGLTGAAQMDNADFNGDGKIDIIAGMGTGTNVYYLAGNGNGTFGAPVITNVTPVNNIYGITSGDFNLDGKMDFMAAGWNTGNLAVYYGNGSGGFTAATNNPITISGATGFLHLAAGDLDGDTRTDVIAPGYGSSNNVVILNKQISISGFTATCGSSPVTLSTTSMPTYTWSTGSNANSIIVTPSVTTTYTVSSLFNGCTSFAVHTLSITTSPTISVSGSSVSCSGNPVTLTVSGANNYLWSTSQTSSVIVVSPSVSTVYSVNGYIGACGDSTTFSVTVGASPVVTSSSSSSVVCSGGSVILSGGGADTYSWTGGVSDGVAFTPTISMSYTVTGTSTVSGCSGTSVQYVSVSSGPTVSATTTSSMLCAGQSATLTASGAVSYFWNMLGAGATQVITPGSSGFYSVFGTDSLGCTDSTFLFITVSTCTGIQQITSVSNFVKIYPNPSAGDVTFESDREKEIKLSSELGQLITVIRLNETNNYKMNITGLKPGIYFVGSDRSPVRQKIVITN